MYDNWVHNGSKTINERAHEETLRILREHTPMPLPADIAAKVHDVVEEAAAMWKEKREFKEKHM
jgi:trimethylamine:corrinoid methyltransferase-like protein